MKVGDKVKVKSWEKILKTLGDDYSCINPSKNGKAIYFDRSSMFNYVDLTGTVSKISDTTGNIQIKFETKNCVWWWHPCWLDLIPEELIIDKNCSSKWLIFCMIFQYLSGNCPNPSVFKYFSTPTKEQGGFNFKDFEYDFLNLQKGKILFPDWPILNLPLDEAYIILEHCYKYGADKKTLGFFSFKISAIIFGGFCWNHTPEKEEYWNDHYIYYKGLISKEELEKSSTQQKPKTLIKLFKPENYENKLQRKKSIVIRGTVPEGSITCGRKRKTSIAVGYLSNSVCIGG